MITVRRYHERDQQQWNSFIAQAKNGLFLFDRTYMEYHKDRYTDHSLLFFKKNSLVAMLPANSQDSALISHGGLTFGGILTDTRMSTPTMLEVFAALISYAKTHKMKKIVYKAIPYIYHQVPASEDLYALFRHGARLVGRDIASVVDLTQQVPYSNTTRRLLQQTKQLIVRETHDYKTFMQIVTSLLADKYHTAPTHTSNELSWLSSKFPKKIRLFGSFLNTKLLAGVVIYEYPTVAHSQYIAASLEGKKHNALTPLFHHLLTRVYPKKQYFSFGRSTERLGSYLNEGLIQNKEHYGGRGVVHDTYELYV